MKKHKFLLMVTVVGLLCSTVNTYAFYASVFDFMFKNATNGNIVTIKKITNPSGATLKDKMGPTNTQPNETRQFFLLQYDEDHYDHIIPARFTIKMSWLLTVNDKKGKIICQNKVLGWVKGKSIPTLSNTHKWLYDIISIQNSPDIHMCSFQSMLPTKLPSSYNKYGTKCYPLVITINKDNSLTVG